MRNFIIPVILTALSGCAVPMQCAPPDANGYQRCDPIGYAPPAPAVSYSYVPPNGPGYAPAYPPYVAPERDPRGHRWVTDTPHWNPGDE